MYTVYDRVAEVFNKPFTEINDASATRAFKESIKDNPHGTDYDLYKIAEYTDHDGIITTDPTYPKKIISGFVQEPEQHLEAVQ